MKLSDLQDEWLKDSHIDNLYLDKESLKIPVLHSKYLTLFNEESLVLRKLESELKQLTRHKWLYYSGKMSEEELFEHEWEPFHLKLLKQDVDLYIESDQQITTIQDKISYQKQKILFLESIIKSLNGRGFLIKNAIDWQRFTNGQL